VHQKSYRWNTTKHRVPNPSFARADGQFNREKIMTREEKSALLLQLIAQKSATAEGFFTADAKQFNAEKNAAKVCRQQLADGALFRVRANQTMYA
jgi:hypothetical protein